MNSIVRVSALVTDVKNAQPNACYKSVIEAILEEAKKCPDIIVLPSLCLFGSVSSIINQSYLLEQMNDTLEKLCVDTKEIPSYIILGIPMNINGKVSLLSAVLYMGKLLGFIPCFDTELHEPDLSRVLGEKFLSPKSSFKCGNINFCVLSCDPANISFRISELSNSNCDLVVIPAYAKTTALYVNEVKSNLISVTKSCGIAAVVASGSNTDTTTPYLHNGFCGIFECGEVLDFSSSSTSTLSCCGDIDSDIISASKKAEMLMHSLSTPVFSALPSQAKSGLKRTVSPSPYLPCDEALRQQYIDDLFNLQVAMLCGRMKNTGISNLVIGISGGLDSTLAVLVAAKALDILDISRKNIIGITMPGFGTSDRTYYNALKLLESLNATSLDIPIRGAVLQHFEDIMHDPTVKDVTYENAQARERSQILFDIANSENALVVGTGDLSEAALGWCTFGGDHLASLNVNINVPKTIIREIVNHIAVDNILADAKDILLDILDTPVSPELLPPQESGEIAQKTEDILGPYELHDFFIYYFIKYRFRPSKIYFYACTAFGNKYDASFIKDKLRLFLKRFFTTQFKRSCAPDTAVICYPSLSASEFTIPGDINGSELISELDTINF